MLYAIDKQERKVRASPNDRAYCPLCEGDVIAKCGDIKIWHWAHKADYVCDVWREPETMWHYLWKLHFPPDCVEIPMSMNGIRHIADVRTKKGYIIEFQSSPITVNEIRDREEFYERVIWVFNSIDAWMDNRLFDTLLGWKEKRFGKGSIKFRWMHPKVYIAYASKPVWLDLGVKLLCVKSFDVMNGAPYYLWGNYRDTDIFIKSFGGV